MAMIMRTGARKIMEIMEITKMMAINGKANTAIKLGIVHTISTTKDRIMLTIV